MHFLTIINITVSIALASLQSLAHAELNLTIPKDAIPADAVPTKVPHASNANRFNLDQKAQKDVPPGYQISDECRFGEEVIWIHYIGNKQYYKCARVQTIPIPKTSPIPHETIPIVRDGKIVGFSNKPMMVP